MEQQYTYIDSQAALEELCATLAQSPLLAIDTEFVRTRTLFPKLGLLQVANEHITACIDPVGIEDLSAFWRLIGDANIRKVLHACSEDLEVFLTSGQIQAKNLVDSQIMMAFLGHGISLGYAATVKHFLDIELDKSESRTDWLKRPLSEKQIAYAANDVYYLFKLYPMLAQQINDKGYMACVIEESQALVDKKSQTVKPEQLYADVKLSWKLSSPGLNRLKHLAAWRYQQAVKRDLPISFVAKDPTLFALAQTDPKSISSMLNIEGCDVLDVRHKGKAMLHVLKQARSDDPSIYPARIQRLDTTAGYKQIFKQLKNFLSQQAQAHQVPIEVLASKKQINHLLKWQFNLNNTRKLDERVDLMSGWRNDLIGEKLSNFIANNYQ